jgi:hypothetical protein
MTKNTLFRALLLITGLLTGMAQLHAQRTTYYFTAGTDLLFETASNWTTNRDGSGDVIADGTNLRQIKGVNLIIPSGDTVLLANNYSGYSSITIENGGILKFTSNSYIYVRDTTALTVESGGLLLYTMSTGQLYLYQDGKVTIKGKVEAGRINGNNKNEGTVRTVDVQAGGELTLIYSTISIADNNIRLINNGTVTTPGAVNLLSLEGQGTLNLGNSSLKITDIAASTFLQAGGGTLTYSSIAGTFIPLATYNNLEIRNTTGQLTLNGNSTVAGNLTVADSEVVTTGMISVEGDVVVSNLADGSALNVTLNGTAQNIEGVFANLEIAAGSAATMTGDLTVETLVLVGALLNPNNYTLTVTNQTGIDAYKMQLQVAINGVSLYTESDYTVASWAVLSAAVSAGQALLAEGADPTTVQLETAKNAVTAAIASLVSNLSALENHISAIKANYGNPTVYTATTYNALLAAIATVEAFLEEKTALTVADVETQTAVIDAAIAGLVRMSYTFYLTVGSSVSPMKYDHWNTAPDGTGVQAVPFSPENIGHTYIIPASLALSSGSTGPTFYGSQLILEAGTARVALTGISLHGSTLTVGDGRAFSSSISTYGDNDTLRVEAGATVSSAFSGSGGEVIVDAGGTLSASFAGAYTLEANGEVTLNGGQLSRITGTGTIIGAGSVTLTDAANSTFLQSGGGTLIHRSAVTPLPSYNHLTVEEITVAATLSREVEGEFPAVPVYGNLLLSNNHRRVEFGNPLAVAGDFTVDYDIEDEAVVRATLTVAGNIALSGLLAEDHALNVTLSGTEEQELSGAGFTNLTLPAGTSAVLTGNLSIEAALALNGVLDRNGKTLSFGERSGNGILTDGLLAAALQDSIDQTAASYPDGSIYTTASWQALQTALDEAEVLLSASAPAEVAALEAAIEAIAAAISGLEPATGLIPLLGDTWSIRTGASTLLVTGNVDLRVVTLAGREVYNGRVNGEKTLRLPAGVYIVTVNGRSGKVVVR